MGHGAPLPSESTVCNGIPPATTRAPWSTCATHHMHMFCYSARQVWMMSRIDVQEFFKASIDDDGGPKRTPVTHSGYRPGDRCHHARHMLA